MIRRRNLCLFTCLSALAPVARSTAVDALSLVQSVFDRPNGRDMTTVGRMDLVDAGGARRTREIVTYRVERTKSEFSSLVRFLGPRDIAGTGLLSVDKADGSNEQWLYLPGLDRVRRVAGDRKGGRFVASDLYFEDLQARKPNADHHRLLGRETLGSVVCEVVESVPVDAGNSVYRKRVTWIDAEQSMAMRVDFFEKDPGTPSKRWVVLERKLVQGIATVMDSRTLDLTTGHATRLVFEVVQYNRKLPSKLFSTQFLADENLEADYRP